ncbi:MAG: NAD-dependent epimerase/dehydratase family protein [Armatimonadota bacterium]
MDVLITGGTGFLGRHTARRLLDAGHRVHLLGRNFTAAQDLLAAGSRPVPVDLRHRDEVIAACAGMDAVCHAGALSAPWGARQDFFAVNVEGTAAVIAGCRQHHVQRLIYISSPSVTFDGQDIHHQTEATPYPRRFASVYSLTKKLGEDLVRAAPDVPSVILRPKAIFGPGDRSLLPRLIAAGQAGRLPRIGDGKNLVDITYVENVAHAISLALTAEQAVGKTYTVTNDEHPPLWEIITGVLNELNIPAPARTLPLPAALAVAAVMEGCAALTGTEPLLTRYSVSILARTQTYDISAARRDLGYAPVISIAEGIERTIAAIRTGNT